MSRLNMMTCMVAGALAGALPLAWAVQPPPARGADTVASEQLWTTVADAQLDRMRGGFNFGGGLLVSVGLERLVNINGQLVTQVSVPMVQLSQLNVEQLSLIRDFVGGLTVIQNGPGNTVEASGVVVASAPPPAAVPQPAAPPTPPVEAQPVVPDAATPVPPAAVQPALPDATPTAPPVIAQPAQPDAVVPAPPPAVAQPTAPEAPSPAPVVTAQATPPAAVQPQAPVVTQVQGTGPGLVIQNTLNDQIIQQLTTINISTNALAMFKDGSWQQQLNDSIRASMGTLGR